MAACMIRNPSVEICSLPSPFQGVLKGGQSIIVGLSKSDVIAAASGMGDAFILTDLPDYAGDLDSAFVGGWKQLVPFVSNNTASGAHSATQLQLSAATATNEFVAITAGSITGIAVHDNASAAGGSIVFDVYKNGSAVSGATATLAIGTQVISASFARNTYTFTANDKLDVRLTTTAGYTATTDDIAVFLQVEML